MRAARRRYWAACAAGSPGQIESAVQEWVEAQLGAAECERAALAVLGDE